MSRARSRTRRAVLFGMAGAAGDMMLAPPRALAQAKELRIGVQFGLGYLPLYVAQDAGLLDKHMRAQGLEPVPVRIFNFTGGPQIQDGLISQSLDIGSGGVTVMMIGRDRSRGSGGQEMRGLTSLSAVPYELWTVDQTVRSLADLKADKNKIGVPSVRVSVPAIFLQMAAEKLLGPGKHAAFDGMTVGLSQPDGATSLLAGGGAVDSYVFAPPFNYQMRDKPNIHRVWSSRELFGTPITALTTWTTSRFHSENPKLIAAFMAAVREAMQIIEADRGRAAEIYIKAEKSKLQADFVIKMLGDGDLLFAMAPQNSFKVAEHLSRIGTLKQKPADWKDYFFAEIHGEPGS